MARVQLVDPNSGQIWSVDETEAEAAQARMGLTPATAEQVQLYQERQQYGDVGNQLKTVAETAVATPIETVAGIGTLTGKALQATTGLGTAPGLADDEIIGTRAPDGSMVPVQRRTAGEYAARALDTAIGQVAPGAASLAGNFSAEAQARRRANPNAALVGAALPELATGVLIPGAGLRGILMSSGLSGVLGEGAETVIERDEYSLADAGLYMGGALAFEGLGALAIKGALRAKGAAKNYLDTAIERARKRAIAETLGETDPARRAEGLRRNADALFETHQTDLDDAVSVIDARMSEAPEAVFRPSNLRKTVSTNVKAQEEAFINLAMQVEQAAQVTESEVLRYVADELGAATGKTGADLFSALRQAKKALEEYGDLGSPLAREALEALDTSLRSEGVWGRAAKNYMDFTRGADEAATRFDVRDTASRKSLDDKLDRARAVATATRDKKLADAIRRAEKARDGADQVTGAQVMGGADTLEEIDALRKKIDNFETRGPEIAKDIGRNIDALADAMPGGDWSPENVEALIAARAVGYGPARQTLRQLSDRVDQAIKAAKAAEKNLRSQKRLSRLQALRKAIDEVEQLPEAMRRVRDYDATPGGRVRNFADDLGKEFFNDATGDLASAVLRRGGAAVGASVFGLPGLVGGYFAGRAIEKRYGPQLSRWAWSKAKEHLIPKATAAAKTAAVDAAARTVQNASDAVRQGPLGRAYDAVRGAVKEHPGTAAGVAGLGAMAATDDEGGTMQASAAGLLAIPIFLGKGGKKLGLLAAMRELDGAMNAAKAAGKQADYWNVREGILKDLFGSADNAAARLVDGALETVKARRLDLNNEKALEWDLRDTQHIRVNIEAAKKELAKAERAGKKAAANAPAREALGRLGETLDGVFQGDWHRNRPGLSERRAVTYGSGGEAVRDVLKKRLSDKAPLSLAELQRQATRELGSLPAKVAAALESVPKGDRIARVAAEDEAIRAALREALGMKAPRAPKPVDPKTDATSRYRKNKKGFDAWASAALDSDENQVLRGWQSHQYRVINAGVRGGDELAAAEGQKLARELASDQETPEMVERYGRDLTQWAASYAPKLLDIMNNAIKAGHTVPGRVSRGISMPADELDRLMNAKTVTSQGFMSTSIHSSTPEGFATRRAGELNETPVMLTIEQRTGVPIGQGEGEITLRPGTKFDVVFVEPPAEAGGMATAYLREVEESTLTGADVIKGLAGKIPTEAKVAAGLLGIDAMDDGDESGDVQTASMGAAGMGALALLFGKAGKAFAMKNADEIMTTAVSGARGTNRGGVFKGADGVSRYVKLYDEPQQAIGEVMAADLYRTLGFKAPESTIFDNGDSVGFASEMLGAVRARDFQEIDKRSAREFAKGFWADVLLANWDAVGSEFDNLLWHGSAPYRVDNGSALKFRAQGAQKPEARLGQLSEIEGFFNPKVNPQYAAMLDHAGIKSPLDLIDKLPDTIKGAKEYIADPGVHDPELLALVEQRLALLEDYEKANKPQRKRTRLGQTVSSAELPHDLEYHDVAWVRKHVDKALADAPAAMRRKAPAYMKWDAKAGVTEVKAQIDLAIDDRFHGYEGPEMRQKQRAIKEYAARQIELLERNVELTEALPEPSPAATESIRDLPYDELAKVAEHIEAAKKAITPEEFAALDDFTGNYSSELKAAQRGDDPFAGEPEWARESIEKVIAKLPALDRVIAKLTYENPTRLGVLYRGLSLDEAGLNELLTLDKFTPKAMLSTTPDKRLASDFSGNGRRVLLRFQKVEKAAPVLHLSRAADENEFVIPQGGAYKVTGRAYDKSHDRFVFDLEQESAASPADLRDAGALAVLIGVGAAGAAATYSPDAGAAELEPGADAPVSDARYRELKGITSDQDHRLAEEQAARDFERLERIEHAREKLGYLANQSRSIVASTARAMASPSKSERTVPRVPGVTASSGVASFIGTNDTLRAAYDERKTALQKLQTDPMLLVDELTEGLGELEETAPDLHAQIVGQTYKVAQFLQSKLPQTVGASLTRPDGVPPNPLALKQFALYYSAATDPTSVFDDLRNNRARREQVDTVRELWPEAYGNLKNAVLDEMTRARPTTAQRVRLDLLFDFGDALDAGLSSRLLGLAVEAEAQAANEQGAPGRTPTRRTQPSIQGTSPIAALRQGPVGASFAA